MASAPGAPEGVEPVMAAIPEVGEHMDEILLGLDSGDGAENAERSGSLGEVRERIDGIDREIVRLLAGREGHVRRAAAFKRTRRDAEAPKRVEEVVGKVRTLAEGYGANPGVVEEVYRAMISGFISLEMEEHARDQT